MQKSLLSFAQAKAGKAADKEEEETLRQGHIKRLGLVRRKKRAGKPSRQQLWEDALFSAIMGNQFDKVAQIQTKDVPAWWNRGQRPKAFSKQRRMWSRPWMCLTNRSPWRWWTQQWQSKRRQPAATKKRRKQKLEVSRDAQI
eukprot:2940316-Amphidinium_carterae.1